jgi:hypothetical protein
MLAARHLLSAPLSSEILRQGIRIGNSLRWAAAAVLSSERDTALYCVSLEKIRVLFSGKGIPTIVLKGASLAFGYPRDVGDIDLLLPEARLLEAIDLAEGAGYAYVGYLRNMRIKPSEKRNWPELMKWANQFEFQDMETGALIELHTTFFEKDRVYAEDLSELNRSIALIIDSCVADPRTECMFLSLEDRVLLLALHASMKRAPYRRDFVLRHIADFSRLFEAGFEWKRLIDRARRFRILPHLYFLVLAFNSFIGGKIPAESMDEIEASLLPAQRALARLHFSCISDLRRGSYCRAFLYRLLLPFVLPSTKAAKVKSILLVPLLLPESWRLEEIYSLRPKARFNFLFYLLEPFRWCILLVKNRKR